jgi:hypothetical protein
MTPIVHLIRLYIYSFCLHARRSAIDSVGWLRHAGESWRSVMQLAVYRSAACRRSLANSHLPPSTATVSSYTPPPRQKQELLRHS